MPVAPPTSPTPDALGGLLCAVKPTDGVEMSAALQRMKGRLLRRTPKPLALGRYRLIRELGRGALGVVFLARDRTLRRDVAIKFLQRGPYTNAGSTGPDPALLHEARTLAALDHPNIVKAFDCGVGSIAPDSADEIYLVMEYVEGESLAAWLETPRTPAEIRRTFLAAGEGLAAAHCAGIIHRDFKPHNVLLDRHGTAKVTDFGLARRTDGVTSIDGLAGTPAFMAPEQYSRSRASARSDQFAFCLSLYAALTGDLPRRDGAGHVVLGRTPRGVVSRRLRRAIVRGLSSDPAERHPGLEPVLAALRERAGVHKATWFLLPAAAAMAGIGWAGPDPACDPGVEVWNDDVRQELRETFVRSGKSYADAAWATVESEVDAYAAAIVQRREALCAAPDPAMRRCLAGRERQLAASIRTWTRPEAVEHAAASALALPSVAACESMPPPPGEDAVARTLIDQSRALARVSDSRRAAEVAAHAIERAEAVGDLRAAADARLQRGEALSAKDELPEAQRELEAAFFTANLARDETVALDAAIALTYLVGFTAADGDGAQRWQEEAETRLAVSGDDGRVAARLHYALGAIAQRHSRFEEAVEHFRAVLADAHDHERSPVRRINAHNGIGLSLANLGQLEGAREQLGAAIELCVSTFGNGHPRCATPMVNLANVEHEAGRGREALPVAQRARRIRERELGPDHPRVADALTALGLIHFGLGEVAEAYEAHREALRILEANLGDDHMLTATARYNVGLAHQLADRPEDALAAYGESLRVMEKWLEDDDRRIAAVVGSMGAVQTDLGRPDDARRSLERALAIQEARWTPPRSLAATQFNLARVLVDSDRTRALALARTARGKLVEGGARPERLELVDRWLAEHGRGRR